MIRSATLYGYRDLAVSAGLNVREMLRRTGIAERSLDVPDHMVAVDAVRQLLELSAHTSGWEDFGLRLAARRRLSNLGQVSLVLREEPTALAAVQTLCRYLQLINPALHTEVDDVAPIVVIRETLLVRSDQPMRQSVEMAVGVMHGVLRELLGDQWRARRVCFSHRAPAATVFMRRLFDCPVDYNADFNGLVCDWATLTARLPGRDDTLAGYSRSQLDSALRQTASNLTEQLRQLMSVLLPQGRCTAEQVAGQLQIDRRTLHRRLAREGTSFARLLDALRQSLVVQQLRDSDRSSTDIAMLLGFSSASAFGHWFLQRFGMSARAWRASQAQAVNALRAPSASADAA